MASKFTELMGRAVEQAVAQVGSGRALAEALSVHAVTISGLKTGSREASRVGLELLRKIGAQASLSDEEQDALEWEWALERLDPESRFGRVVELLVAEFERDLAKPRVSELRSRIVRIIGEHAENYRDKKSRKRS